MIFVIFGILVALCVTFTVLANRTCSYDLEEAFEFLTVVSVIFAGIALIIAICLGISVSSLGVIDEKIEMYQEENMKIETEIAAIVSQYQEYETGIFTSVAPDSSVALVALYPDLKSDTLTQKQIETYTENNNKIKELKEEKINGSVMRWWLYFGG